ncbi:MAG: cation diffusion facilitator family transporter, partial [Bacillota bacterium]|nr:cation diffusion facilitator family transporter [Bacillota bacterium]
INNFFDAATSVVATVSAKISAKEADAEHPYGHGRAEYISALMISFLIVVVGFELLKTSISCLFYGERGLFGYVEIGFMILAVIVKVWIIKYNTYIDRKFDSAVNRAVAQDAKNDVFSGLMILLCLFLEWSTGYRFEVLGGILLSLYVIFSGYRIAKDMVGILLGTSPTAQMLEKMETILSANERIHRVHNWKMHEYGPGRRYCSVNVCMRGSETLFEAHELIDSLERQVLDETGVEITIHIDPVDCSIDPRENNS